MLLLQHDYLMPGDIIWRYNRPQDLGRCTASAFDMSDYRNLIPEE